VEDAEFARLVIVMARLATGDRAAVFTLYELFGRNIAASLRRQLHGLGVTDIERDELDGLVIDGCLAIAGCAAGWEPDGGALPWTWAERRLMRVASAWVGVHHDSFDAERHDRPIAEPAEVGGHCDGPAELHLLGELAIRNPRCALLLEALELVASARDRAVVLELRAQSVDGDPSPAATIGNRHGLSPAAVRQVASRVRQRLRDLALEDDRFAGIADLPLVA
jgi:hypothetical protein